MIIVMLDFHSVGPVLAVVATVDVALHLHLDMKKAQIDRTSAFREPLVRVGALTMFAVAVSTLLSFVLVLLIIIAQPLSLTETLLTILITIEDPPVCIWLPGFGLLLLGIVLHGWSRWVRQSMASSWEMRQDQTLVKNGPYSRVRHPSYTSYILSFLGLLLMIPSVATALLLIGIPGYYSVAVVEERHLVQHFGKTYEEYMAETGRFFPTLRRRQVA